MDVLHLPLDQLAQLSMQNLLYYQTLERANNSNLYNAKWEAAGIKPQETKSYADFAKLP